MIASDTVLVPITGGQDGFSGIPRPDIFGIDFLKAGNFLIFVSVAFMLTLAVSALIRASPFGQVLIAIRTNEVRAEQLGFNVKYFKIGVLMMSGFFAALGYGARLLAPVLARPGAWVAVEALIGAVMWMIAASLVVQALT